MRLLGHDLKETTIGDLVRARAVLGDKPLLWVDDDVLTYRDAHESSDRYANALAALGVAKGDVVATYAYNSIDHVRIWFACAKLGAIWAPVNVSLRAADLECTLRDTSAKVFILDENLPARRIAASSRPATQIGRGRWIGWGSNLTFE